MSATAILRNRGLIDYQITFDEMKALTHLRDEDTPDEIWLLEHPRVFTLGQAGKREHVLAPGDIPVVKTDRGGQVTYHGPGQLVCYFLLDIKRKGMGVRDLVTAIELAMVGLLKDYDIDAESRKDAPGVYVNNRKIGALGLRVRKGRCYHGLSLNVDVDLEPFTRINPCGYQGLEVTNLRLLGVDEDLSRVSSRLINQIKFEFGYDACLEI